MKPIWSACLGFVLLSSMAGAGASSVPGAEEAGSVTARIRIRVTTPTGTVPAKAYVAVVAETSPWSEPTEEAILDDQDGVEWTLAPGRYRVVAGAPGYTLEYRPVVDLAPEALVTERAVLLPLVPIEGRVADEQGAPIEGAVVSDLRQLVYGFGGRLSPLGESHLRGNFEAVSDREGMFRKDFHPTAGHYLAIRTDARVPRFFSNLRVSGAAAALRDVVLRPGSSFKVTWPESSAGLSPYDRLELVPSDRRYPPGLELPSVLAVWARPLPGSEAGGSAEWSSLPAGSYEVWLKAPPRGVHDFVPVRIAEVNLEPGERIEREVELPPGASDPVGPETGEVRKPDLRILVKSLSSDELDSLKARGWWQQDPTDLPFETTAVSGGLLLNVEGGCRPNGLVTLESHGQVGGVSTSKVAGCEGEKRLRLLPRADVTAKLVPPPGVRLPKTARLDVAPCVAIPGPTAEPVLEVGATIDDSGRLAAPVMAGCVDVAAHVGDFAPVEWEDLDLEAGSHRNLGSARLRHGSALLARVLSTLDGRPIDGVTVSVAAPQRLSDLLSGFGDASAARTPGATTSEGGWARLYGLPPGRELVVLLQAEDRPAPHPAAVVELSPGEERILDALELPPPTELDVQVELSEDLEEIEATAYKVFVRQVGSDTLGLSFSQAVDPDGSVRFRGLPPGQYRLEGIVRAADGKPFPAGATEIELLPGEQKRLAFALNDTLYRGRVTYEGIPVEGALSITPVSPPDRRGMSVRLSPEGEFRLPLEGPGTYTVRVGDGLDGRFSAATIPAVEFADPDEEVQIRVPEGRIAGRVIDASGEPVSGARIELRSRNDLEKGRFLETRRLEQGDPQGTFTVEALTAGAWTVTAGGGDVESEPRVVQLIPNERIEKLELVLREGRTVSGTVSDAWGRPVAGADVWITPQPTTAVELPSVLRATTDSVGAFSLSTVLGPRPANVEVVTAGGMSAALRVELGPELRIELPAMGGAIELDLPCSRQSTWLSGTYFLVNSAGGFLPVPRLGRVDSTSREPCRAHREVSGLGVGRWQFVLVRTAAEDALLAMGQGAVLSSHGEVVSQVGAPSRAVVDPEEPRDSETEQEKGDVE